MDLYGVVKSFKESSQLLDLVHWISIWIQNQVRKRYEFKQEWEQFCQELLGYNSILDNCDFQLTFSISDQRNVVLEIVQWILFHFWHK